VPTPVTYLSEVSDDGAATLILMEDLSDARMADQVAGADLDDAMRSDRCRGAVARARGGSRRVSTS
jgi:hypothetical protein